MLKVHGFIWYPICTTNKSLLTWPQTHYNKFWSMFDGYIIVSILYIIVDGNFLSNFMET